MSYWRKADIRLTLNQCPLSVAKRILASRLTQLSSHHLLCVEGIIGNKCCLGVVCHHFQWTIAISKALQAVRIRPKELFGSKNPPLNDVDEFMTEDMVAAGFAASLSQPGGNITGISLMSPDLDGKRQDILIEAVPGARRIAVLADSNASTLRHLQDLENSARTHGTELLVVRASNADELIPAMNDASTRGAVALNVLSSPMLQLNRRTIIKRAGELRLPAIYQWPETAEEGGMIGYGPSFIDIFRQRAAMVAKVLRGAKPAELPIEQPSKFKLVINLKTAKAINYAVPTGLMLRADKIIE